MKSNTITEVVHFDTFVSLNDCINYVQWFILNKLFFFFLFSLHRLQIRISLDCVLFIYRYQLVTHIYTCRINHTCSVLINRRTGEGRLYIRCFFVIPDNFIYFFLFCFVNTRVTSIHHTPIYVIWLEEKFFYFVSFFSLEAKDKKEKWHLPTSKSNTTMKFPNIYSINQLIFILTSILISHQRPTKRSIKFLLFKLFQSANFIDKKNENIR